MQRSAHAPRPARRVYKQTQRTDRGQTFGGALTESTCLALEDRPELRLTTNSFPEDYQRELTTLIWGQNALELRSIATDYNDSG